MTSGSRKSEMMNVASAASQMASWFSRYQDRLFLGGGGASAAVVMPAFSVDILRHRVRRRGRDRRRLRMGRRLFAERPVDDEDAGDVEGQADQQHGQVAEPLGEQAGNHAEDEAGHGQ